MHVRIAFARHKLLYHHPFGTAHGVRDCTDALYLRLEQDGHYGYGEATFPPYLPDNREELVSELYSTDIQNIIIECIKSAQGSVKLPIDHIRPAFRNVIAMAVFDLIARQRKVRVSELLSGLAIGKGTASPKALFTIGLGPLEEIPLRIKGMPNGASLKVKVGGEDDARMVAHILELTDAELFLDGNQGFRSVEQVIDLVELIGIDRLLGIEQPFGKQDLGLHRQLRSMIDVPVYADESIQGLSDLGLMLDAFDGVNIKLMKCGGLDRAVQLIEGTGRAGRKVMLGCMSEATLGCAAMAQLAGHADVLDLDGPWLIANDPFQGVRLSNGKYVVHGSYGIGVELVSPLNFIYVGA